MNSTPYTLYDCKGFWQGDPTHLKLSHHDIQLYRYYKIKHSDQYYICRGVESTAFEYTLRHVTTKFAYMNGHWKDYNKKVFEKF